MTSFILNKSLYSEASKALINNNFKLNQLRRYFPFTEEDTYLRVYSQYDTNFRPTSTEDVKDRLTNKNSKRVKHYFSLRYDTASYIHNFFDSTINHELHSLLTSYLLSSYVGASVIDSRYAPQGTGWNSQIEFLRLPDTKRNSDNYYSREYNFDLEALMNNFMEHYNQSTTLPGSIESVFIPVPELHVPYFSHGMYRGSSNHKSYTKALNIAASAEATFRQFISHIQTGGLGRRSGGVGTDLNNDLQIKLIRLRGSSNSFRRNASGTTSEIPLSNPVQEMDGLYAVVKFPEGSDNNRWYNSYVGSDEVSPIFSMLSRFVFIDLSKAQAFNTNSGYYYYGRTNDNGPNTYSYANSMSDAFSANRYNSEDIDSTEVLSPTHHEDNRGSNSNENISYFFKPTIVSILPDRVYADQQEIKKRRSKSGLLTNNPHLHHATRQEFLDLTHKAPQETAIYCDRDFFNGTGLDERDQDRRYQTLSNQRDLLRHVRPRYGWYDVLLRQSDTEEIHDFKQADSLSLDPIEAARTRGYYWYGFGSTMQQPIHTNHLMGSIMIKCNAQNASMFMLHNKGTLDSTKYHTTSNVTALNNTPITRDEKLRGKGHIYVDHDNVAYCPISGDALRVSAFTKNLTNTGSHSVKPHSQLS